MEKIHNPLKVLMHYKDFQEMEVVQPYFIKSELAPYSL